MNYENFLAEHDNIACYDAEHRKWYRINSFEIRQGQFSKMELSDASIDNISCYILPGFIDAHCHLLENPYPCDLSTNSQSLPSVALNNALTASRNGVTTLKDMGGYEYQAIEIIKTLANFKVPRLFTSGCYFTTPGGHCSDHGAIIITDINSFYQKIQRLLNHNIKFCKIINSDDGFSSDLLCKMIDYAHQCGMLVSCHAYTEKAAYQAVLAGTDILEHAGDYSDKLLNLIQENNIIIVPTFVAAVDSTPQNCEVLSDVNNAVLQEWIHGENVVIPKIFSKKLRVALGTDSGFLGTPCDSLLREIKLIHNRFSIPISDLLFSAFVVTPATVGMEHKLGKIECGYYADFLCYDLNPVDNIDVLMNPKEVWINGERVDNTLSSKIVIRRLEPKDLSSISLHMQNYYFDCAQLDDYWTNDEILAWIRDSSDYCIGAFANNILIGFGLTHYHKATNKVHIENIFVLEQYRNEGVAQRLVFDIIAYYCGRSTNKIRFVGLSDTTNQSTIGLLEKNKFVKGHPMYWMQYNSHEN